MLYINLHFYKYIINFLRSYCQLPENDSRTSQLFLGELTCMIDVKYEVRTYLKVLL